MTVSSGKFNKSNLITKHRGVFRTLSNIYMLKLFCEDKLRFLVVNYFLTKASVQMFDRVLNMLLKDLPNSSDNK